MGDYGTQDIGFSDRPNEEQVGTRYQLVRTPANKRARFRVLSHKCVGVPTHFYRGRTQPHTIPTCEACDEGITSRWHGYIGVQGFATGEVFVLEITAHCEEALHHYTQKHGTLRGADLSVYRRGSKANSPVHAIIVPGIFDHTALPAPPDVEAFLRRIWYGGSTVAKPGKRYTDSDDVGNEPPAPLKHNHTNRIKQPSQNGNHTG